MNNQNRDYIQTPNSPHFFKNIFDESKILLVESGIEHIDPIRYVIRKAIRESTRRQKVIAFGVYMGVALAAQTVFPDQYAEMQCNSPIQLFNECEN